MSVSYKSNKGIRLTKKWGVQKNFLARSARKIVPPPPLSKPWRRPWPHSIILASCKTGFRPGLQPGFRQVRAGLWHAFDTLSTFFVEKPSREPAASISTCRDWCSVSMLTRDKNWNVSCHMAECCHNLLEVSSFCLHICAKTPMSWCHSSIMHSQLEINMHHLRGAMQ